MKTTGTLLEQMLETVSKTITQLEGTPLSEAAEEVELSAGEALDELEDRCGHSFSAGEVVPVGADTWADFERYLGDVKRQSVVEELAGLATSAAVTHPALTAACLSAAGLRFIEESNNWPGNAADAPARARRRFQRLVAVGLQGIERYEPAARILAADLPHLQMRFEALVARRREHVSAEAARIEREHAERLASLQRAEEFRRTELAEFFGSRDGLPFVVGIDTLSGGQVARALRRSLATDLNGRSVRPSLSDIEKAYERATATQVPTR